MSDAPHDVLVAGGGPAGAAAAIALARSGHRVLLAERSRYEAFRPGEALPPYASVLLDQLGVRERFLACAPRPAFAIRSAWGTGDLDEQHFLFNPYGDGWHIDRRRFDAMLADAAEEAGATVLRGARVVDVARDRDEIVATIEAAGATQRERARFVVDATGRGARVARALGARGFAFDRLVGVMGVVAPDAAADDEVPEVLLLEAARDGWWYASRLPGGALLVAWMTDGDELARSGLRPGVAWTHALECTHHIRKLARGAPRVEEVRVRKASTARLDRAASEGWIAVGDAASAFDPLSAVGVCKAIESGLFAAEAVRAHFAGDGAALAAYGARVDTEFRGYLRDRARYYRIEERWPGSLFWRRRQAPDPEAARITLDPRAALVAAVGASPDALAAAEGLLPPVTAAWLVGACAAPVAAHELLSRCRACGLAPVPDRDLIVALQLLLEGGALRVAPGALGDGASCDP